VHVAIVVSFLNEAELLPTFLASMGKQTRPPDHLLLVNDGSTDDSGAIAEAFARDHDYARVVHRPPRPPEADRLALAGELRAFHWGVEQLSDGWDVVSKMDADLDLAPDHIQTVMSAFESDPQIGIAGTFLAARLSEGRLKREVHPHEHVRGPTKFYRRQCFEQIEPLPEILGWDAIDELRARMHGWRTLSAEASRDTVHLRPTGAHDGRLRAFRRWGLCAWGWGATPLYVLVGAVYRLPQRPFVLAGVNYFWGYVRAALRGAPRADPETRAFARLEEKARLRRILSPAGRPRSAG
jgi:glycosyltransferase involved in cell wall biosynthesis